MRYLARFILAWLELDLAIANNAPVKNVPHIVWLKSKISEWEDVLFHAEYRLM